MEDFDRTDEELRQAYKVVIKVRAKEITEYAHKLGVKDVTAEMIRGEPFLCIAAIGVLTGLIRGNFGVSE
jgi:hypothetical protein